MARIRSIKPELPSDKTLAALPFEVRYCFLLLISQADDYGLVEAEPRQLLGKLYPHDEAVTLETMLTWVAMLVQGARLRWRVTRDGARVLEIVNWEKHQHVKNPGKPLLRDKLEPADVQPAPILPRPSVESTASLRQPDVGLGGADRERDRDRERDLSPSATASGAWSRRAIEMAEAVPLTCEAPRIARVLGKLVKRDGPEKVLAHWAEFLESGRNFTDDGRFINQSRPVKDLTPERFLNSYDDWAPSTIRRPAA